MTKKVKKFVFPGATLLISFYVSLIFSVGLVLGYLGTAFFYKKYVQTGRVGLVDFPFGRWNFHFHHWLLGGLLIFLTYLGDIFFSLPVICFGFLGGLIFHDIYHDKRWYKVVYRKKN